MTPEQAAKEVQECDMYLQMFDGREDCAELLAALHAKWVEAKKILENAGVFSI